MSDSRDQFNYYLINVTILCFIFRASLPYLKYPFFVLITYLVLFVLISKRTEIASLIKINIRIFYISIILGLVLILSFFLSEKYYLIVFKDIINFLILLVIYFILTVFIIDREHLLNWLKNFSNLIIGFAVIESVFEMLLILNILADKIQFYDYLLFQNYIEGKSLDYNFGLLPVIFAAIIILNSLSKSQSLRTIVVYNLFFTIFIITIFFSGSRRGIIIMALLILFLILLQLFKKFVRKESINTLGMNTVFLLPALTLIFLSFYFYTSFLSYKQKYKSFEILGSKNVNLAFKNITSNLYRYYVLFDKDCTQPAFHNKLWTPSPDPNDPDSGWATRTHTTVFPLHGENVEIVPENAMGYLMDKSCNSHSWTGNAYSFTVIGKDTVKAGELLNVSVYCYVSKDFDGTYVMLYAEGAVSDNRISEYDLNRKGTWQMLSLELKCSEGEAFASMYFSKFGVTDFSKLNGYVIFAYPVFNVTQNSITSSYLVNNSERQDYLLNLSIEEKSINHSGYRLFSWNLNFIEIFSDLIPGHTKSISTQDDEPDLFRKWISGIFSEDTVYYNHMKSLRVDSVNSGFSENRIDRWRFAWQIYSREYSFSERIFGGGFDFLNWYGYYFLKDKTKSDWPHNPFLSVILFSGVLGLILYLVFLCKVFYYYLKYLKSFYLFFIFFLITFYFSFFSSGNPFDPPAMGFFVMLPFLLNYILKRDRT